MPSRPPDRTLTIPATRPWLPTLLLEAWRGRWRTLVRLTETYPDGRKSGVQRRMSHREATEHLDRFEAELANLPVPRRGAWP